MASAEVSQNGAGQNLLYKTPRTDWYNVWLKIYDGVGTVTEFLVLVVRIIASLIYAMYEFVVPSEPKSVNGEIILITGAGHGIGREVALRFARLGGVIVCVDINPTGNQQTVDMINEEKGKAYRFECDITDRNAVVALAEKVRREVGDVTMLVNNAGILHCKPLLRYSEKEIRSTFEVNIIAHFWLLQSFLPAMIKRNHGHIVAMSSTAGLVGDRNMVAYSSTKFSVRGFMEALHEELRENTKDFSGIKLTVICPHFVDTGMCKRPRFKFASLMKMLSPQETADSIVDAVRRNYYEITIPSTMSYLIQFGRIFPRSVFQHVKDFIDTGADAWE